MSEHIRIWEWPVIVAAQRGRYPRVGASVQVHATRGSDNNPMVADLTPQQAAGMADVLSIVGATELAEELREASVWAASDSGEADGATKP